MPGELSIDAIIRLRRDRLAQDVRDAQTELKNAVSTTGLKVQVPVELRLASDAQQKLNAAVSALKVPTLTIPVNFAVQGQIPGMPGGAGGGGMPMGAASPNFAYYFGQLGQQMQAMAPQSSPNWSYLMRGRAGPGTGAGGLRGGHLFNPLSPRGLSRLVGSGLTAYGFMEAQQLMSQSEASSTGIAAAGGDMDARARAMLAGREHMLNGTFAGKMFDTFLNFQDPHGYEMENIRADLDATKATGATGDARFRSGMATGSLERQSGAATARGYARRKMEIANQNAEANEASRAAAEGESASIQNSFGIRRANLQRQLEQNDHALPYETAAEKRIRAEMRALDGEESASMKGVAARQGRRETANTAMNAARVRDAADDEYGRHLTDTASASSAFASARASGLESLGDPIGAMRAQHAAEENALTASYDARLKKATGQEYNDLSVEKMAKVAAMRASQGLAMGRALAGQGLSIQGMQGEADVIGLRMGGQTDAASLQALRNQQAEKYGRLSLTNAAEAAKYHDTVMPAEEGELVDRQRRQRELQAGQSDLRIGGIGAGADERMLRAKGEAFTATIKAITRGIEDHAKALELEAKATPDATRAAQLRAEATATRRAGKIEVAAYETAESRAAERDRRVSGAELATAGLAAGGQSSAARNKSIEDDYQEELRQIGENAGDPQAGAKRATAKNRRDARLAAAGREDRVQRRSLGISTADSEARAQGQEGVGTVESMIAEFRDMEANATTPEEAQAVRRNENARIAAFKRGIRPQAGKTFGLAEYRDALQSSITQGASYDTALKDLATFQSRQGVKPSLSNGADPTQESDRDLKDAANNLNDAAKVIKGATAIGIIRRRG